MITVQVVMGNFGKMAKFLDEGKFPAKSDSATKRKLPKADYIGGKSDFTKGLKGF